MIKFYKVKDYCGFCSNFYPSVFYYNGYWWKNVEEAYQAAKAFTKEDFELSRSSKSPKEARDRGQQIKLINHWDFIRSDVMYGCVLAKFLQNQDLSYQLIETGDEELIENSPVDYFWGCGKDGTGQNMLGKTLMNVRKILKSKDTSNK